jgi:hypothetical protein
VKLSFHDTNTKYRQELRGVDVLVSVLARESETRYATGSTDNAIVHTRATLAPSGDQALTHAPGSGPGLRVRMKVERKN